MHACWLQQQQVQQQPGAPTLLDVVVCQRAAVLQLLARKDEALLVGRDALLVLCGGPSCRQAERNSSGAAPRNSASCGADQLAAAGSIGPVHCT